MLIPMKMLRNFLLVCELGMPRFGAQGLFFSELLLFFYCVEADAIEVDREVLESSLLVNPGLVLSLDLLNQHSNRNALDASLTVDHVRPGLF